MRPLLNICRFALTRQRALQRTLTSQTSRQSTTPSIFLETEAVARLATASVTACSAKGSAVLATVSCPSLDEVEGTSSGPSDSVALGVNFVYKHFAQPSSIETAELLKKERSDSDQAVLVSRIIDRAIRPRFPEQLPGEIMVSCLALAHDPGEGIEALAVNAVSACLSSRKDIPFDGPIAAVRICKVDGKMLVDPSVDQIRTAEFDLLYVGSKTGAVMVEFSGDNVLEKEVKKAFKTAQQKVVAIIEQLNKQLAKNVQSSESEEQISNFDVSNQNQIKIALKEKIYPLLLKQLSQIFWQKLSSKTERNAAFGQCSKENISKLQSLFPSISEKDLYSAYSELEKEALWHFVSTERVRLDGRKIDQIRPIKMISGIAKNADGSSLFQRGNTQSLCSATVMLPPKYGTQLSSDKTPFSLNYEFPSFAVNEARNPFGRKSRREVGHGSLAKKALLPVLPSFSDFPFEIHVNSLITESDGSSSMATVCGGSLALANAGVPIKQLVAGIGIGLCPDCSKYPEVDYMCLTDILGFEDMQGLMDFKIAGTLTGITAMQLDIKLPEVSLNVLAEALEKAKVARASILKQMSTLIKSSSITPYLSRSSGFRNIPISNKTIISRWIYSSQWRNSTLEESTGCKLHFVKDGMNSKVYAWVPSKDAHGKLLSLINESVSDFVPGHEYEFDCVAVLSNGIVVVDKIGREHRILKSRLSQGLNSYKIGQKITVLAMQKYDDIFLSERAHSMRILSEISRKTEELDEIDDDVNYEEIDHEIDELTIEI